MNRAPVLTRNTPAIITLPSLLASDGEKGKSSPGPNVVPDIAADSTGGSLPPPSRPGNVPAISASVALVADVKSGQIFLDQHSTMRWPLASVSKLMTAVVATDVLSLNQNITITQEMFGVDPNEKTLHVGDTYTVGDLLRIMLLPSDNVAAEALADFYGRSHFLEAMVAKAKSWGMNDTYYDDPSGLSAANQSTARDLLKLAQNMYANYPQILGITRTSQASVKEQGSGNTVIVKSINDFAGQSGFIGGKTGYTDQAGGNLFSLFSYMNHPVLIVVLGADESTRFNDTQTLYDWFKTNFKL